VNRLAEFAVTALAGAIGSILVVLTLGASLVLVLPVMLGVGVIFLAAGHEPRSRDRDPEPERLAQDA
jgi:uncharacterized membrane protein